MKNVQVLIAFVSALIAAAALLRSWREWRSKELRRDDVLAWGVECIAMLQKLYLICLDGETDIEAVDGRLPELRERASVLIEHGRLFFRNAKPDAHGQEKEEAYRGYRPCILDPIVVAYQAATSYSVASAHQRKLMRVVLESYRNKFVSLLQKEVGRGRTASADTSQGGRGMRLQSLMSAADRGGADLDARTQGLTAATILPRRMA